MRDQSSGFPCPTCKEALVPIFTQDRFAFAFGCAGGHIVSLNDLFARQTAHLRNCFEGMIATWEKSISQMAEGADLAGRLGYQDLAQRLRRRVDVLQARVLLFRENFLKSDPDPEATVSGTK